MVGCFSPNLGDSAVEEIGNLQLAELPILGKRDADDQPGDAPVPGHEAPRNFLGIKRDSADSFRIVVAQGTGVVDERLDDQLVLEAFAMGMVCNRVDAGDVGSLPKLLGHLFDGDERFPRENGAAPRRHGNKCGIGESVGVFQLLQRGNVRIVLAKMIPNVDIHFDQVPGTGGEDQRDEQGDHYRQPSATHGER